MKMIVGLGNPGIRYAHTRHNLGFLVLDALAEKYDLTISKKLGVSLLGQGYLAQTKVLLVKPQTYMNRSGESVGELFHYFRDGITDFLVIHDDLDLPWGKLRFKQEGGSGGHNGLKSISQILHSTEYCRLKVGIGRPPAEIPADAYVLSSFSEIEKEVWPQIVQAAVAGLETWCREGIQAAMNQYNSFSGE